VWGIKIIALEESTDFAALNTKKLFSKLKSQEMSRKGRPNHYASLTSKAFITSARVGGHDANPTNTTVSSRHKVNPYFHLPMSESSNGWWRVWFFLRNDTTAPLPMFTGSRPVPEPNWGYGVVKRDLHRLQPLCEINTRIHRVLAPGTISNSGAGPAPLREEVNNTWVSLLRLIVDRMCQL
jgi:hypothetical protein